MRTELWGLRDKETHELIFTYRAVSQNHKALFPSFEKAKDACLWYNLDDEYEPFKIVDSDGAVSKGVYKQVAWERDIAIEQLSELGLSFGQKIDGIYLTREEHKKLLEYKYMYESLCK